MTLARKRDASTTASGSMSEIQETRASAGIAPVTRRMTPDRNVVPASTSGEKESSPRPIWRNGCPVFLPRSNSCAACSAPAASSGSR